MAILYPFCCIGSGMVPGVVLPINQATGNSIEEIAPILQWRDGGVVKQAWDSMDATSF